MKNYIALLLLIGLWSCTPTNNNTPSLEVLNNYSFEQLDSLQQLEQRPVAVFFHTDWCKYCENMKQTTLKHQSVISVLNQEYYFISFDGEFQEAVHFKGKDFNYIPNGRNNGMHELCYELAQINASVQFPSFVLLRPSYEITFQYPAFLSATQLLTVLNNQ